MGIILCKVVKPKFTFWLIQVVPPILVVFVRSYVVCCDNYEKMTVFGPKRDTKATKHTGNHRRKLNNAFTIQNVWL